MSQMIRVTLPDGSAREVVRGTTAAQIAADIGPGLAKAALAAKIDGELRDITRPLEEETNLSLVTVRDEADALELVRHDYAQRGRLERRERGVSKEQWKSDTQSPLLSPFFDT